MYNPYQSPAGAAIAPGQLPARRPWSAWLLMLALALVAIAIAFGAINTAWYLVAFRGAMSWRFLGSLSIYLALMAFCVAVAIGIARRRPWGRWLGVLIIAGFAIVIMAMPDTSQYANEAQRGGGLFGRLILTPLLMAAWGYRFAFSARARRYFAP